MPVFICLPVKLVQKGIRWFWEVRLQTKYLADIQVTVQKAGEQMELKSLGIATEFDLTK